MRPIRTLDESSQQNVNHSTFLASFRTESAPLHSAIINFTIDIVIDTDVLWIHHFDFGGHMSSERIDTIWREGRRMATSIHPGYEYREYDGYIYQWKPCGKFNGWLCRSSHARIFQLSEVE